MRSEEKVFVVGVGPGELPFMSMHGAALLARAGRVLVDATVSQAVRNYVKAQCAETLKADADFVKEIAPDQTDFSKEALSAKGDIVYFKRVEEWGGLPRCCLDLPPECRVILEPLPLLAEEFVTRAYIEQTALQSPNKYARRILQDAEEVNQAPGATHDFEKNSRRLGITPVHYRRLFKTVVGVPPYQYLQQCRLSLAIRLLRKEKQLQIQQIAAECGFGSATEFSRFFKKQTGVPPLNYSRIFFE